MPPLVERALVEGLPLLDRRWKGKFLEQATLVGPEARGSSPVRFLREHETLVSTQVAGLYPVGEGAGYAGGIISAALDGLRAAKSIIKRYAARPPIGSNNGSKTSTSFSILRHSLDPGHDRLGKLTELPQWHGAAKRQHAGVELAANLLEKIVGALAAGVRPIVPRWSWRHGR